MSGKERAPVHQVRPGNRRPSSGQPAPQTIYEMAANYFMIGRAIEVAAELDIFTPLARRAATPEELALHLGASSRGMRALCITCTALGLLEKQGRRYRTTSTAAALLVNGQPGYAGHLLAGFAGVYSDWVQLDQAVRTGQPVAQPSRDKGDESLRQFVLSMHASSQGPAHWLVESFDLGSRKRLLDVGGGAGTFAMTFCQKYSGLEAVVLDLPDVITVAQELIAQADLHQRIRTLGVDYREAPFPAGYDVVLLCNVLHQEDIKTCRSLLRQSYDALNPGGIVVVLDAVLNDEKTGPLSVALGALNNLIHNPGGETYSAAELKGWIQMAGFDALKQFDLPVPNIALLVATKSASH